jgi:hypothetical protein
MKTTTKLITPKIAEELLKLNVTNRPIKPYKVAEYARQMACGLWMEETGETIKISCTGKLIDGQMRLTALIMTGVSLKFSVNEDLDDDVYKVIDQGVKRSPGDVLHNIISDSSMVAAGIRKYMVLKKGWTTDAIVGGGGLSNAEIHSSCINNFPFWEGASKNASSWYKKSRVLSKKDFLGFYAYLHDIDDDDSFNFCDVLSHGENLRADDPIKMLREKLLQSLISGHKITPYHKCALIFKAWNYFRKKESITRLVFIKDEKFPTPI